MSNIILIGYMGCGKSTIGKKLSYAVRKPYVDTDKLIETKEKKTSTPPAQIRRCDADVVFDTPSATEFGITFDEITVGEELCREHRTS